MHLNHQGDASPHCGRARAEWSGQSACESAEEGQLLSAVIGASVVVAVGAVGVAVANEQAGTGIVGAVPAATITTTTGRRSAYIRRSAIQGITPDRSRQPSAAR